MHTSKHIGMDSRAYIYHTDSDRKVWIVRFIHTQNGNFYAILTVSDSNIKLAYYNLLNYYLMSVLSSIS